MPTDPRPDDFSYLFDAVPSTASPTEPAAEEKPKRKRRKGWQHPTKARVKDEAKVRFGKRSRVVNFRLSEPEWVALNAAMKAAGVKRLSAFVRHLCLAASAEHLPAVTEQSIPMAAEPQTAPADASEDAFARWMVEQDQRTDAPTLFPALAAPVPTPAPVVTLPAAPPAWVVPATVDAPPRPPAPAGIVPATISMPEVVPTPPRAPTAAPAPAMNLALLRQLRDLMGDDAHVTKDVLAALDAEDRKR